MVIVVGNVMRVIFFVSVTDDLLSSHARDLYILRLPLILRCPVIESIPMCRRLVCATIIRPVCHEPLYMHSTVSRRNLH